MKSGPWLGSLVFFMYSKDACNTQKSCKFATLVLAKTACQGLFGRPWLILLYTTQNRIVHTHGCFCLFCIFCRQGLHRTRSSRNSACFEVELQYTQNKPKSPRICPLVPLFIFSDLTKGCSPPFLKIRNHARFGWPSTSLCRCIFAQH